MPNDPLYAIVTYTYTIIFARTSDAHKTRWFYTLLGKLLVTVYKGPWRVSLMR